jgi:spore maturation protein CgeB
MLSIAFLRQGFLVQREVIDALKRLPDVSVTIVDIPDFPSAAQAEEACRFFVKRKCSMVFTVNDWGLDFDGVVSGHVARSAMIHVNWCVDDPFFMEIVHDHPLKPSPNRIDFVSNRSYVQPLREKGMNAHFLALAADTSIFFPVGETATYGRGVSFVGNSYRKQLDELCKDHAPFLEGCAGFLGGLLNKYEKDPRLDIEAKVNEKLGSMRLPPQLPPQKAVFLMKHFISYVFRKRLVCCLARTYEDFMVFGDEGWLCDLPQEKVSRSVGYYINLNETYARTKINIDINRIVITEGLTQRVFDCSAGGNFVLTSNKPVIEEFFAVSGPNREAVVFDNDCHLTELIDYFLKHDNERLAIAGRARQRVLAQHTYDLRMRSLFRVLSEHLGTKGIR